MAPPNTTWKQIISQAQQQPDILQQAEVVRNVLNILQTHVSVCSSLGPPFVKQMSLVYAEMLSVYKYVCGGGGGDVGGRCEDVWGGCWGGGIVFFVCVAYMAVMW